MNINPRDRMITLLKGYLQKDHVEMKNPMRYYLNLLESGENLRPKHLNSLVPFLRWDLNMNERQLRFYFADVVSSNSKSSKGQGAGTLEGFF